MSESLTQRPDNVAFVEGLRGVAVLAVFFCHVAVIDFNGNGPLWPGVSFAWSHGVDLFFVISGFCMAEIFRRRGRIDYGRFLARRFIRIAPAFYIATIAFFALERTPFGTPGFNNGGSDLVHSLLFAIPLMGARVNGVLWTIAVEARWYVICPAILVLYRWSPRAFIAVGVISYVVYALNGIKSHFDDFGYLPCFMMGVLASDLYRRDHPALRFVIPAFAVFLPLAILTPQRNMNFWHGYPTWHFAVFLGFLVASRPSLAPFFSNPVLRAFGTASYSIYLTHLPVLLWLVGLHLGFWPSATGALTIGFIFWAIVERPLHGERVRASLEQAILSFPQALRLALARNSQRAVRED